MRAGTFRYALSGCGREDGRLVCVEGLGGGVVWNRWRIWRGGEFEGWLGRRVGEEEDHDDEEQDGSAEDRAFGAYAASGEERVAEGVGGI